MRSVNVQSGLRAIGVAVILSAVPFGATAQDDPVVAIVGGDEVHREELVKEAEQALEQTAMVKMRCELEADRNEHKALEAALEQLVRKRLLSLEAAKDGVTSEEVVERAGAAPAPIDQAAIDTFYEQNSARIGRPKEEIEEQIRQFLEQQELQRAQEAFFAALEMQYEVDYRLDPLRTAVEADGFTAYGPADAPVTIVEFSDFECPYCGRLLPTLEQAKAAYPDQLRIVYRHFPLSIHANAQKAAEASLCADDQGKFWEMHDLLFAEQSSLSVADLKEKASRLGLDTEAFDSCLDENRHFDQVQEDLRAGTNAGVDGTPAMFINGRFLSGAVAFGSLAEIVDDELRRQEQD